MSRVRYASAGRIDANDWAFINRKRAAGVPDSAIERMMGRPIPRVELPKIVLTPKAEVAQPEVDPHSMEGIALRVAREHDLEVSDLVGPQKARRYSRPRAHAMHEMYAQGRWSLPQIGRFFGRDHTTVLAGIRAHAARMCGEAAE